ncbi:uncharacterized protein LOC113134712 isoform X2 [Mastacembelus armatus]|uniref:uncharacterized protein LOC113134712 isoform X2 n=1 Tax=Mastacembelus armatus TaxID=205130 RepID=UPI000E455203|nr:uncharacterized protein LOC113134712 isoform X2 [Mastacembelus armatus]
MSDVFFCFFFNHIVTFDLCRRSVEYCLKWKRPMSPKRSSRLSRASKKNLWRNSSPNEETVQCRASLRQKTGQRKTKAVEGPADTPAGRGRDIINIINSSHEAEHVEDEETFVHVAEKGLNNEDEDSDASSTVSGPSRLNPVIPTQHLCPACQKLYQKARKMKKPIKNKLLNNDPKSLTCDQWALIKKWRPRMLHHTRGKLLSHVQQIKKRLKVKKGGNKSEQYIAQSSACSRPHIFLLRNHRHCVKVAVKQERKKAKTGKRARDDSQGSRLAKQQRLHSTSCHQHIRSSYTDDSHHQSTSGHSSRAGFESCGGQEIGNQADTDLTVELVPPTVVMETTKPREPPPKTPMKKTPKKTGFRDMLARMRANSSKIVRETVTGMNLTFF